MENIYKPFKVKITKIEQLASDVKLFRLERVDKSFFRNETGLSFVPGQFVLVSHFGYGEAPFGPASSPHLNSHIDIVVRKAGILTDAMHQLKRGNYLFMRGPYGNGFPIDFLENKDVVMVTGGCGIPPIAALIELIIESRSQFNRVHLIYGARTPHDLLLKSRFKQWQKDINLVLTVDKGNKKWKGKVGLVTEFVKDIKINPNSAVASVCGPGPMVKALVKELEPLGIPKRRIFASLERKMQCGVGKCQHCLTGKDYVCQNGPVFNLDQLKDNWD